MGFDTNGSTVSSAMETLVKTYLNGKTAGADKAIIGMDTSGNAIVTQDVGYWKGTFTSSISYTEGSVVITGDIRLNGNASSQIATQSNHLTTLGQIQSQIQSIQSMVKP